MEREIGEEFDVKIRVKTVESSCVLSSCTVCALRGVCDSGKDNYEQKISDCYPAYRTDGKNVYYRLVAYEEV